MLMFAHGFNIRFGAHHAAGGRRRVDGRAEVARAIACASCSSKAAARRRCSPCTRTPPATRARWRSPTPRASASTRAGVIETTFAEETETDLFGEQAVLCGGVSALVKAGFETLVEAGYQPEIAYFECLHELKLIVDLMYRGGLNYMRYSVSDTAEHGDYTGGPRIVTDETRRRCSGCSTRSRTARTPRAWIAENEQGRPHFTATRAGEQQHQIEEVGAELRAMMPFLEPGDRASRRRDGLSPKKGQSPYCEKGTVPFFPAPSPTILLVLIRMAHTSVGGEKDRTNEIRRLSTLLEISQALSGVLNLKAALQSVLEILERRHQVVGAGVFLQDPDSRELHAEAVVGRPPARLARPWAFGGKPSPAECWTPAKRSSCRT